MLYRWLLCGCVVFLLGGCSSAPEYQQVNYTAADFVGSWDTTLPNGERWLLVLHEDGRFDSLPVRSSRAALSGQWSMQAGKFYWTYPESAATGGVGKEVNPIIMKTAEKFMLQERMGMQSVYLRHVE